MQFSKVIMLAAGASAAALNMRSTTCNSIAVCKTGGKTECQQPEPCKASGGNPFCCTTTGLVNVLNCFSLLDGNTVNISLLDGLTLPITL